MASTKPRLPSSHKTAPITVAEKIIADISSGIYRTPAAALKELVANAYDADATHVEIVTDAPRFAQLVIRDDGEGMTIERFLKVFEHIGGSWKRIEYKDERTPLHGRKVIGRIGIGLLAVAQLGQRFYVASSVKGSSSRFIAEVDLRPFHRDDAALHRLGGGDRTVDIGNVKYADQLQEDADTQYTVITVPDPKAGLVSELHNRLRDTIGAPATYSVSQPAPDFRSIVELACRSHRADIALDAYHLMLWELGLICPVRYFDDGPIDSSDRPVEKLGACTFQRIDDFELTVDDMSIRRPLLFPSPNAIAYGGPDPIAYPITFDEDVAGRRLQFSGYIYVQKPRIDPGELQGVQVRVRGVGIGGFDRSWLGYPLNEGLKFGQLVGEVYVGAGLESALNIDRASFRETDPHYLTLRAKIWELLRERVFPDFKSRQAEFRRNRKKQEADERERALRNALRDAPEDVDGLAKPLASEPRRVRRRSSSGAVELRTVTLNPDDPQNIVRIESGEVLIDPTALRKAEKGSKLNKDGRERLLRVCAVLAAYSGWSDLTHRQAEELLAALAIAVRE